MLYIDILKNEDGKSVLEKIFIWENPKTLKRFFAPRGFVTDFVSTRVLKLSSRCDIPALFHDVDYWYQNKSRTDADRDYRQNLLALGVGNFSAWAQYSALRAFGWAAWNDNKKQRELQGDAHKILSDDEINHLASAQNVVF